MIRLSSFEKYEEPIRLGFQHFFNNAKYKAIEISDFLICQQGGFLYNDNPCIGLGEVGINNLQKVNIIENMGSSILVQDNNYFKNNGYGIFNGTSTFEKGIITVSNMYLDIWENELFLRTLTQVIKVANGEHYDWNLDLSKINDTGKGNFIRNEVISKLVAYPELHEIIKIGYNSNLRNAIGHSQYHVIQGGIMLDNYGRNKYANIKGFTFEEWEKIVVYGWLIFRYLFSTLFQITSSFVKLVQTTLTGGIPILIPQKDNKWSHSYIYPDITGKIWRFVKTI